MMFVIAGWIAFALYLLAHAYLSILKDINNERKMKVMKPLPEKMTEKMSEYMPESESMSE